MAARCSAHFDAAQRTVPKCTSYFSATTQGAYCHVHFSARALTESAFQCHMTDIVRIPVPRYFAGPNLLLFS